ncbi:MAG: hypothetical protein ABSD53_05310 [Terriglobales bacterium]|jgi:hypothetical protein
MLAGVRSCFLLFFLILFAAFITAPAQVNGVPASVTSLGFGGKTTPNGVRASVTSLGPNGYPNSWPVYGACCVDFFMPGNANSASNPEHRHHRKDKDKDKGSDFPVGVVEPVYIPYGVPYAADDADDGDGVNDVSAAGMPSAGPPHSSRGQNSGVGTDLTAKSEYVGPLRPEEPVVAQPSTVLIFRDGHRSEILNYAVVGDTLFDLGADRTHRILLADLDLPATRKANDDRGVDFQVPESAARK